MKLAIVIPYYKIDYFEETIKSVAEQTNKSFVLYIGNDKSPNDPLPIINKYLQKGEYYYFDYSENYGGKNLVRQWERILENVNEEWFQILGDDDVISLNFVEEFYKQCPYLVPNIGVIKMKNITCDTEGRPIKEGSYYDTLSTGTYDSLDFLLRKYRGSLNSSLSEHIFRTKKYKEIGFVHYPLAWHSDDMLFIQASNLKHFYFIDSACVFIKIFSGSISGTDDNLLVKNEASKLFFKDLSVYMKEHNVSWYYKRNFLKSLRKNKRNLGLDFLKNIYFENGFLGKLYYRIYLLKLLGKKMLPKFIVLKLQGEA